MPIGHYNKTGKLIWLGKKHTEGSKEKISKARKGKPSNFLGHHHTIETKQKLSQIDKKREKNPRWKGGKWLCRGYWIILKPQHHLAMKSRYVYEHLLILEQKLNRKIKKGEVGHHINGNKSDNRPENLYLMTNKQHLTYENNLKNTYLKWIRVEYNSQRSLKHIS